MNINKLFFLFCSLIIFRTAVFSQITTSEEINKSHFELKNLSYAECADSLQKLDLFFPVERNNCPVIVFFHGGGWIHGDKESLGGIGKRFAETGLIFISANYRLSPKVKHPTHIEDAASAVKWVWDNITSIGGDTSRIFLAGHSAGAHLASLLVTDNKYLSDKGILTENIAGVIGISGVYLIAPNPNGASEKFLKSIFGDSPEVWQKASPVYNIQDSTKTFPKFLISWLREENPLIIKESENFTTGLNRFNHDYEKVVFEGSKHFGFINTLGNKDDELTKSVLKFIGLK